MKVLPDESGCRRHLSESLGLLKAANIQSQDPCKKQCAKSGRPSRPSARQRSQGFRGCLGFAGSSGCMPSRVPGTLAGLSLRRQHTLDAHLGDCTVLLLQVLDILLVLLFGVFQFLLRGKRHLKMRGMGLVGPFSKQN